MQASGALPSNAAVVHVKGSAKSAKTRVIVSSACFALIHALWGCDNSTSNRTTRSPGEPASSAAFRTTDPAKIASRPAPGITASSQTAEFGPLGLLSAAQPGWHSAQPPKFPESLTVDFQSPREVKSLGLLQQDGQPARSPKALRVEISDDGEAWTAVAGSDNVCTRNTPDGWSNIDFSKSVTTRYVKVLIFSNCGDPHLLTVRGLRFG